MPVCNTCSGTSFACLDGKFFCCDCDTQSQDFVEEQAPELLAGPSYITKQLKKRVEKGHVDVFLPWKTVEGFQQIVKGHVNALIELGVDPRLDEVMQQIWFKYVQETGLAIISSDHEVVDEPENEVRYRDFFLNQCKRLGVSMKRRPMRLKISNKAKKAKSGKPNFDKDDEWFSVATESEPETSRSEGSDGGYLSKKEKAIGSWQNIKTISMLKVICFCYLALRWIGQNITIGDLLHWAELGRIPYYRAADCLAPHMKLQQFDYMTFVSHRRLEHEKVTIMSGKLFEYLQMPPLPEVDIRFLVARYLHQLNLPLAFSGYVSNFISLIEETRWPKFHKENGRLDTVVCRSPEMTAAAVIIIAMKYLFVLDNNEEFSISASEIPCPVHGAGETKCRNFTWKSWAAQHSLQRAKEKATSYTLFDDFTDPSEVGDLHACMEHHSAVIAGGAVNRSESRKNRLEEQLEARSFAFERLLERQGSSEEKKRRAEERLSPANLYVRLGRGDDTCSVDFTPSCIAILVQEAKCRGSKHIRYSELHSSDKLSDFHHSYSFLLEIVSRLTKAKWMYIHDYVSLIETFILE